MIRDYSIVTSGKEKTMADKKATREAYGSILKNELYKNEKIVVPPVEEQDAIVEHIKKSCVPIDGAIYTAEKQIALLQERKQIIINDVVTGKVKVC